MGSFDNSDTVKAEKANAMRRYTMKRILTHFLRVTLTLLFLSISFINYYPVLLNAAKTHLCSLNSHFFAFLFLNSIVFIVYLSNSSSSNSNNTTRNDSFSFSYRSEFYEEYVAISNAHFCRKTVARDEEETGKEKEYMQLAVVLQPEAEEVVAQTPILEAAEEDNMVVVAPPAKVENYEWKSFCNSNTNNGINNNSNNNISNKNINSKFHRRTRSEMWRGESEVKMTMISGDRGRLRELRRSESTKSWEREVVVVGGGCSDPSCIDQLELGRKSMEEMNNEEFRLAIEMFIANKKKLLRDENVALLLSEEIKTSSTSVSITATTHVFHSANNAELFV